MKKLVLALLAASCAIPAFAGDIYAGASIGAVQQKLSADGVSSSENTTGFKLFTGYQFTPVFGAEVGYAQFGDASESDGTDGFSFKPSAVYVAATGTWALTNEVAAFAKLGVARDHTKIGATLDGTTYSGSANETSALIGVGVSYALNTKVSITAEYENFGKALKGDGGSLKISQVSIGARYKF
jgi:OOP family OmpA-OmpF porin